MGFIIFHCNFTYSLLGIETSKLTSAKTSARLLQFHLLPIRDWNFLIPQPQKHLMRLLQFQLLPIRDWN